VLIFAGCKLAISSTILILAGAMWPAVIERLLVDETIAASARRGFGFGYTILRCLQMVGPGFVSEPVLESRERLL